jgi:hypothetical protein
MGILLLGMGGTALFSTIRKNTAGLIAGLALTALLAGIRAPPVVLAGIAKKKSVRDLALLVREKAGKESVVASFGYVQGLPFYAQRRIVVVGDRNELEFGSRLGDHSNWFIDRQQFDRLWSGPVQVFVLVNPGEVQPLMSSGRQTATLLGISSRWALVTNR